MRWDTCFGWIVAVLAVATGTPLLAAVAVLAAAAYAALAPCVHPAVALVASAMVLLIAAATHAWIARSLWRRLAPVRTRACRDGV